MSTPMRYFLIGVPTDSQRQVSDDAGSYVSIDKLIGLGDPYSSSKSEYSPNPAVAFEGMISRQPDRPNIDYSSPSAFTAVDTVSCPSKSKYARPAYVADKYTESYFRQRAQDVRVVDCHSAGCSSPGGSSTDSPTNACVIAGNESVAGEVRMTPMVDQHIETMYVSRDPPISKIRYGDNQCYVLATDRLTTNQPTPPLPNFATSNNKDTDVANASDEQPLDLTKPKRLLTSINGFPMDRTEQTDCSPDEIPHVTNVSSQTLYDTSINTNGRSDGSTADNGHTLQYLNSSKASFMENVLALHTSRNAMRNNNASHVSTNDEIPKIQTTHLGQRRMSQALDAEQIPSITLNDVDINVNIVQSDKPRGNSSQTQTISIFSKKHVPNNNKRRKKGHQCPHCPKAFPLPWKLKIHIRVHTGEKPFQCDTCGKRFSVRCNLRDHVQLHTGDRRWPCKQCAAKFSWPSQLKAHQRVHSGERPYLCRYCPMTFSWSSSKNHHERGHTGEKNFPCTKCSRKYHRKSALDTHCLNHHERDEGLKPFVCSHCNQSFSHKTSLTKHLRKHTGEKPYRCLECSARFDTLRAFHKHRNLSHSSTHPLVCELCLVNFHTESDLKDHNIILHSPVTEEQDASRKKGSQESKLNTGIQSGDTNDDDDNKTMDETCVDVMEIDTTNKPGSGKLLEPLPIPDKSSRCLNSSKITRSIACHSHQEELTSPSVIRHNESKKSKEKQGNIKDVSIGNKASLGMIKTNTTQMVADDVSQMRLTQLNSDRSDTSGQMLPNLHLDPRDDENSHVTYQQESPHVIGWYPKKVVINSNGNITDMRNGAPSNRGNQDTDGTRLDKADTKSRDDPSRFDKSNSILSRLFGQVNNEYPLYACQAVGKESGPLCEPDDNVPHRNQSLDAEVVEILPGNTDRKSETASFLKQLLTFGRVNTLNDKEYLSKAEEGCSHPTPGELNTKTCCHLGNSLNNGKSVKHDNLSLNINISGQQGIGHDKYNGCTVDNERPRYFGIPLPCGRGQQAEKNLLECSTCKEIFSCHEVLQAHIISCHRHINVYEMSKIAERSNKYDKARSRRISVTTI